MGERPTRRRSIAIVGAGQAGLYLGIDLIKRGFDVTICTDRAGDELRTGPVLSSQCMFGDARALEVDLGIDLWDAQAPEISGMRVSAYLQGMPADPVMVWSAPLKPPAQSIDQRLKMPTLMETFEKAGGELRIGSIATDDLESLALSHDLCVVAAGKGSISALFPTNDSETPFQEAQRHLAMAYVCPGDDEPVVNFNVVPDVGEFITYPALSESGPCQILLFESVPGGPADRWRDDAGNWLRGRAVLDRIKQTLSEYFTAEAAGMVGRDLIDDNAAISGGFRPVVRHPVGTLPSGRQILGMSDVVVLNDPITAQGANNAVKCASIYARAIADHDGPFDTQFMTATFDKFWEIAGPATRFTTQFLGPSPAHAQQLHAAAVDHPEVAERFAETMNDPRDADAWILSPDKAHHYLASVTDTNRP